MEKKHRVKIKNNLPDVSQNNKEVQKHNRLASLTGTGKNRLNKKENSKLRIWVVSGMVMIILLILGTLISFTLTSNSTQAQSQMPGSTGSQVNSPSINNSQNATGSAGEPAIMVGPPGHQLDLSYPGSVPVSMKGPDISTPDPAETALLPFPQVMGAFATTADLATLESFYSQKIKTAGYDWDSIEVCYSTLDSDPGCPNTRAFAADFNNCNSTPAANSSQTCLSTFQISLWFVGAKAGPEEFKKMNMPQSIISQLIPGRTLVVYNATPNIRERPNYSNNNINATMAATTAALVPTPTRGPLPTAPVSQSQIFVGPDNAFHSSQYEGNPDKQTAFGASLVTVGEIKVVALGSERDGTFQLDWLVSEEGVKTTLQARVVTSHNTAYTSSKGFTNFGFVYLTSDDGRSKIPVHLVNSSPLNGAPNTFLWNMEAQPLPPGDKNYTLNFEQNSGIALASPIKLTLKSYTEAGLPHPVSLQPQNTGGQAKGLWLVPQFAYFGNDQTILSLAFQPDIFRDKEAYYPLPQLVNPADLKVTDDKGRTLALLDPLKPLNLSGLVFGPVASDAKSLKIELGNMVVGRNLNQPTTSLENAPVTRLSVPVAELLKLQTGQTVPGPTLQTPGIQKLSVEGMSAKLDDSGEYLTLTVRYRATGSLAYPPYLIVRSAGFSCEKCGQENSQWPVSSRMLPDGSIEFNLTYKYDPAQTSADLKVDSEQFVLPGPWQFEVKTKS